MEYIIGIDVGGTFTDGVAVASSGGALVVGKQPTTYPDPLDGVLAVLEELARNHGVDVDGLLARTEKLVHGTTLTSNVLLERRGAKVGLLATQGFGDAIHMMSGKGRVAGLSLMERRHFRATDKPDPIVPPSRVVEVPERVDVDGDIIVGLDDDAVRQAAERLEALGVDACAIALLWSFRNDGHERRLARALSERLPGAFVSISSDVAPLLGEYERTATTVVNAYVGPAVREYLATVEERLRERGLRTPLLVLQSSGGVSEAQAIMPVNTIESGPAAGVRGSALLLEQLGLDHAIVTDVGGTTFKVAVVRDRRPTLTTETVLGQYSLLVPMVDVASIGAGGGSIAWVDGGRLRVGPKSAASDPGPACYGWGGTEPTVTDADVLLGYVDPDAFLGGQMRLDVDAARTAMQTRVADELFDGDVIRAAAGVRRIVDAQMADLVRKTSLERGHDPRDFVLFAYGGAGPVHVGAYGAEIGSRQVVIPANATVFSAVGAATSDLVRTFQISRRIAAPGDLEVVRADFDELEAQARASLTASGVPPEHVTLLRWAGMRYRRQFSEVRVELDLDGRPLALEDLAALVAGFERSYAERYGEGAGHGQDRVEFVRFAIDAIGRTPRPALAADTDRGSDGSHARKGERDVYWVEHADFSATPVYDGARLAPGNVVEGPAVIEHPSTAIVVHPGQRAELDPYANTLLTLQEDHEFARPRHL
jgi:N-methylhydantoinase A